MTMSATKQLECPRCAHSRPAICVKCGSGKLAVIKAGVSRLREELAAIEAQLLGLRSTILNDLHAVQRIADHQLVQARLRSEVSTLAQNRLATRLQHPPE